MLKWQVKDVTFSGKNFLSPKQAAVSPNHRTHPILKWQVKDVTTHTKAASERCNVFWLKFSKSKPWDPDYRESDRQSNKALNQRQIENEKKKLAQKNLAPN